jgi:DNA repair photolyase
LVVRDDDLLAKMPSSVALTITTDDDNLARLLEPNAPLPSERLRAVDDLITKGIPVSVRIDPVIPFVNEEQKRLVSILSDLGVKHLTVSTYKPRPDNWRRLSQAFPEVAEKLKPLYFQQGERVGGNTLLSKDLRLRLLKSLRDLAEAEGVKFGVCREGLPQLNTAPCDGSWLIPASEAR